MKKLISLSILVVLLCSNISYSQEQQTVPLKWVYSIQEDITIEGFKIYYGPSYKSYTKVVDVCLATYIEEEYYVSVDIGLNIVYPGYYTYDLELPITDLPTWITMVAYSGTRESIHSNVKCIGTLDECGEAPEPPTLIRFENICARSDIDKNNIVGMNDFMKLSQHWGWTPGMECK
jgi:hypothetical protein